MVKCCLPGEGREINFDSAFFDHFGLKEMIAVQELTGVYLNREVSRIAL